MRLADLELSVQDLVDPVEQAEEEDSRLLPAASGRLLAMNASRPVEHVLALAGAAPRRVAPGCRRSAAWTSCWMRRYSATRSSGLSVPMSQAPSSISSSEELIVVAALGGQILDDLPLPAADRQPVLVEPGLLPVEGQGEELVPEAVHIACHAAPWRWAHSLPRRRSARRAGAALPPCSPGPPRSGRWARGSGCALVTPAVMRRGGALGAAGTGRSAKSQKL